MSTDPSSSLPDPFQLVDSDEDSSASSSSSPAPSPSPSPSLRPVQPIEPLVPSLRHQSNSSPAADTEVALTPSDTDRLQTAIPLDDGLPSKPPTPPSKSPAPAGFAPVQSPPAGPLNEDGALGIDAPALCSPGLFLPIPDVSSHGFIFGWGHRD